MPTFCQDRDILAVEPVVYLASSFAHQQHLAATDGDLAGSTFTSTSSDFQAAGVTGGMVLVTYTATPSEGCAWEILSVDSPTTLSVSVLRSDAAEAAVPPPAGADLSFCVRSFLPQIASVSGGLSETLRRLGEADGITVADFADSMQLRRLCTVGVLAEIFRARAENARPHDANWIKAEFYRDEFRSLKHRLRLVVDADGDGLAEQTRTLGNVRLTRS